MILKLQCEIDHFSNIGMIIIFRQIQEVCFRIKGFVNTAEGNVIGLQVVFGSVRLEEIPRYVGPSEMIAFSESLTPKALRNKFIRYTNV